MYIADLHIHSHYSRATSRDCTPEFLDLWARRKGIHIIGTGDFTHPAWREELKEKLSPAEEGLYLLKDEYRQEDELIPDRLRPRFVITGEISSIYKKNGRVRKVHSLILLPSLEAAQLLSARLETIGNIHSDGRPILGLDCRDLLEILLELCPSAVYVPAHIWTPHFSLFGAFSGFDSIEECFGDLTPHIHALETGLSSDPPMNWRISALDSFQLISNSDAHSPAKLGREANLVDIDLSYPALADAIQTGRGLYGTIEFFPEEGKYHYDGHRKCHLCLSPTEASRYDGRCPICGKKLTIGVMHRVEQLADRAEDYVHPNAKTFESLAPLMEVIAASTGRTPASSKVQKEYQSMLRKLGPEFSILRQIPIEEIRASSGFLIAEGIRRLRSGEVERSPGFDGEYGTIKLLDHSQIFGVDGQLSLFTDTELAQYGSDGPNHHQSLKASSSWEHISSGADAPRVLMDSSGRPLSARKSGAYEGDELMARGTDKTALAETAAALSPPSDLLRTANFLNGLNESQAAAVQTAVPAAAVIAGPGAGKTHTLVSRILYLMKERKVKPTEITAVTFTNKAAAEMKSRLQVELGGKRQVSMMNIGTFHSICFQLLHSQGRKFTLADEFDTEEAANEMIRSYGLSLKSRAFLRELSRLKTGLITESTRIPSEAVRDYQARLEQQEVLDYDDLLLETLRLLEREDKQEVLKNHFNYLLVDEFQDISPLQGKLIRAWNRHGNELFVIGDPDQAIYGFRGSDSQCFEKLKEDFPGLALIRLEKNYRSTPEIIDSALSVISRNPGEKRRLASVLNSGLPVRMAAASGELSEAIFVVREINRLIGGIDMLESENREDLRESAQAKSFADMAVLYRTHRQADQLEYCLKKEGIPYVVAGRDDFLGEPSVRGTVSFFRWLYDQEDRFSLRSCLRLIWGMTTEDEMDLLDAYRAAYLPLLSRTKPAKLLHRFMEEQDLAEDGSMKKLAGMSLLYKNMGDFLDDLTFGQDGDLKRCGGRTYTSDSVTLMTFHGSKGLEFPIVFLYGLRKGLVPLENKQSDPDIEEERRLFYVAMTRAKEELILCTSAEPSPFLEELPKHGILREAVGKKKYGDEGRQMSLFDFL